VRETSREYPAVPIPAVAAVVFHEGRVLLTLRGNEPSRGLWGIPGGVIEVGELVEEAVTREVMEETGVRVRPEKLITTFDSIRRDPDQRVRYHYILFEYLCRYEDGEPRPGSDALDATWVPLAQLDSVDIMSSTKRFIEKVAREEGLI